MADHIESFKGMSLAKRPPERLSIVQYGLFLKLLSLFLLFFSIKMWADLLGINGEDLQQIYHADPFHGVLQVILTILVPVLSVGLWLAMRWGLILWGLATISLLATNYFVKPLDGDVFFFTLICTAALILYSLSLAIVYFRNKKQSARNK